MDIKLSETALRFLKRKEGFYLSHNRKAKLVEVSKTCHGAEFRVIFEAPSPEEIPIETGGCEIYVLPSLMEEYGGFSVDTQSFFFAPRLHVSPVRQNYACDCKAKCHSKTNDKDTDIDDKEEK